MERFRIGVVPARAMAQRSRLLDALAQAFAVTFEARAGDSLDGLDGLLVFDRGPVDTISLPPALHALVVAPSAASTDGALVRFGEDARIERPLRLRQLIDTTGAGRAPARFADGDTVLATVAGRPVWWRKAQSEVHVSAFGLEELGPDETLRERLRPGRFMGLVALVHLLRDVCEGVDRPEQPLQASFVIDDPNLHRTKYGFLDYAELIADARAHGYHVGLAMVPLDGWMASRRAASLVRANGGSLSVLVHGNDHVARELGRLCSDREAERAVAQALRRTAAFERRSGVAVRRVMVPPHGACSEQALRAMLRLGFEAACISRPYPWRDGLPAPSPLAGWRPAELVAGGLPVLPRHHLHGPREDLVFRALLGQPLILYGHHWDLAGGLDVLAQAAYDVNALGDVRWRALDELAWRNCRLRRQGDRLNVEMYSRRVRVAVGDPVAAVKVHTGDVYDGPLWSGIRCDGIDGAPAQLASMTKAAGGWESDLIAVRPPARIELTLAPAYPLQAQALSDPGPRPWPLARRLLVEGRDRVRPLLSGRPAG